MAVVGVVKAIITADTTQFKKGMHDANRAMSNAGANMSKVGKSMTMKVTMPLVGLGLAAAKMASDFEFSMTQIETLVGRSAAEVETLKGAVLGLSGETGRAPKELADAMFFITSAGLDAASATAALEMSAKAAAVGLGDTSVVADAVTNAMNGYGMAADGAAFATDVLAKTVEQGKASAADLAPQFGRLIPMAAELGISFDQVGGGLAFLTRSSGDAALSATQLGGVMKSILKPSQQAKKTFEEIGVDLGSLRAAASKDLLGALQSLRGSLQANGKEMGDVFEDIRGLNGALMLTGKASGQAREVFDELADSSGKLEEAFAGVQKTAQFKVSQAMAGVKASMITLGAAILPVVVPMLQTLASIISKIAEAFGALPGPVQKIIVVLGILLALTGPILMMMGSITTAMLNMGVTAVGLQAALSAVILPLLAIVAAAAVLIAIWKHFSDQSKEAQERTDTLRASFVNAENDAGAFKSEIEGLRAELDALNDATDAAAEGAKGLSNGFGELDSAGLLLAEVIKGDVRKEFNEWITDMDHHNTMMRDPAVNNGYQELADSLSVWTGQMGSNIAKLNKHRDVLGDDADAIIEAVAAGDLQISTLKNMLTALDETADAQDDLAKENKKLAKAWLEDIDNTVAYVQALDGVTNANGELILDLIALAEEEGRYVDAATLAIDATAAQTVVAANARAEVERQTAAQAGAVAMMVETSAALRTVKTDTKHYATELAYGKTASSMFEESSADLHDRFTDLARITPEAREGIAQMNANIEAGIDPLGRYGEELRDIAAEAGSADRAMMQLASGGQAVTDALEFDTTPIRTTYPIYEAMVEEAEALAAALEQEVLAAEQAVRDEAERIADEIERQEAALQVLKDAQQERIDLQQESLDLAKQDLAELEALADAARAPVEALKDRAAAQREGFDALRGMRDAQNDLADATETVKDIEDELDAVRAGGGQLVAEATEAYEAQQQVVANLVAKETALEAKRLKIADKIVEVEKQKADIALAGSQLRLELEAKLAKAQSKRDAANEKALAIGDKITAAEARHAAVAEEGSELRLQLQKKLVQATRAEEDARRKVLDVNDDIAVVTARIADINDAAGEFQREITYELNEQRLAYYDIGEQVAKLEDQQAGLTQQAIESQEELIEALKLEQAAITEVEQALIDLGIITAADAAEAGVTARQAQGLIRLRDELAETEAQVQSGEATTLDLIVAQEEYNKALADTLSPIDGMSKAVSDLAQMEKEAERIGLQLAVARDKESKVLQAKTKLENSATLITDANAEATAELTVLEKQRTRAEEDLAEAVADLTVAEDIETRVAEAQAEITLELTKLKQDQTAANDALTAAETALTAAKEYETVITAAQNEVEEKLIVLRGQEEEAADRVKAATDAVSAAKEIETALSDVHAGAVEEEARLVALLEEALWDQVTADYAVEAAQIRLAESGDKVSDAIDKMTEKSPALAAEMILLQEDAAKAWPEFDTMREKLLDLEPQIATATTEVDKMTTALAGVVAGMEALNRTKIDPIVVPPILVPPIVIPAPVYAPATSDIASGGGGFDAAIQGIVAGALPGATPALTPTTPSLTDAELMHLANIFPPAHTGGTVARGGLMNLQAGELITPAQGGGGGTYITVNVEGSVSSERELVESIRKGLLRSQQSGRAVVLN